MGQNPPDTRVYSQGLGFNFRVWGLGRVWDLGLRVPVSAYALEIGVWGFRFLVFRLGFGFKALRLVSGVKGILLEDQLLGSSHSLSSILHKRLSRTQSPYSDRLSVGPACNSCSTVCG